MAKKNYRKKKNYGSKSKAMMDQSPTSPLGKTFKLNTRYVDTQVTIDPGIGGIPTSYVFSLNSLYDPDVTGTGHQPLGFDQLMGTMYDHYTVIGARARVTAHNLDATYAQVFCLQIKDDSGISTNIDEIIENGQNSWVTLGPSGSGGNVKSVTAQCNLSKFLGRKVMQNSGCRGSVSSGPLEQVYLHLIVAPTAAVDTSAIRCSVEIEYVAILTEPKQLTSS